MREAIESARYEFKELNHALDQFQFHKDKYSFLITPSAKYKPFYELIKRMKMQLIVAVPDEKLAAIAPLMDQSIIVTNAGNHCFTDELGDMATWEEELKHEPDAVQGAL